MKTKLVLLLAVLAAFFSLSGIAQAGVTINPNFLPTYTGSDGTGTWSAQYTVLKTADVGPSFQYEALSYIHVGETGLNYRSASGYDLFSDVTEFPNGGYIYGFSGNIYSNSPDNCVYPGFHWFGVQVLYRWRKVTVPPIGPQIYGAWSAWTWSPVSSGTYGQVCV